LHFNYKKGSEGHFTTFHDMVSDVNLIAVDTIRVDEQSRLTLTRNIRRFLPFEPGDKIAVYRDKRDPNNLTLKVQRREEIVERLTIARKVMIGDGTKNIEAAYNYGSGRARENHIKNGPANILLVDDEQDVIMFVKAAISFYSNPTEFLLEGFTDAQEALKHFLNANNVKGNSRRCHVVITDIRMHGLNGIQLYQILKALDPTIRILFLSGLDAAQEIISMLPDVRSKDIIKKPVGAEELIKILRDTLE
jgi:CheY-like chemotaxis protein